jgi:pre-mRNA cleavage complex 2 protein Pcf11
MLYIAYVAEWTRAFACRRYAGAVESLYENMGLQCVQCGLRFPTDGKDAMQGMASHYRTNGNQQMMVCNGPTSSGCSAAHMDWHFRTNKRQKEQVKGRMTRKWYMTESEWMVSDDSTETTEEAGMTRADV